MIALFTDFGWNGPYVGQMKTVLFRDAPDIPVVDLMHDAPAFNPKASAYLLAALATEFPAETIFVAVVDPGVGSPRRAIALNADNRWFIGPDNGLFALTARRSTSSQWHEIVWRPTSLSNSFHGRDLFAPIAAQIANGSIDGLKPCEPSARGQDWPDDLAEVIYCDHYGNAITGIRADAIPPDSEIVAAETRFQPKTIFADGGDGEAIWHQNSNGLVELAINQGNAEREFGLSAGSTVEPINKMH